MSEENIRSVERQGQPQIQDILRQVQDLQQQLQNLQQEVRDAREESQQEIRHVQRQVQDLQQQLNLQSGKPPLKELQWNSRANAPFVMSRGACVLDVGANIVYFMSYEGNVCSYNITNGSWSQLPQYHYKSGSLALVNCRLTAIGGRTPSSGQCTDKLWSLDRRPSSVSWTEFFPPMPTSRCEVTAISTSSHLIVAGGTLTGRLCDATTAVEVLNTTTSEWSAVASLRRPHIKSSAVLCGSHIYMLGGKDEKEMTKSVVTCSLPELLASTPPMQVWHSIADTKYFYSTCAAVNGELLAFGGCDKKTTATNTIHKYNAVASSWDLIGHMPTAKYYCLVETSAENTMLVVGGFRCMGQSTNDVDIATCTFSSE